ncbi:U-box domain-containing protein [Vigna angularis]|uniref:U-box domain-containing protein n=2 Tax=Phaseolus angularis TaxID=3914 RepID=A0A8T0JT15_PHAAN|nr:U-box domain-containing protein [Vigna angularis]
MLQKRDFIKLKQNPNPNPKTLFLPESKASTFASFLQVGHKRIRKRRRNVAAVLHSGFLHSSSDPLCAIDQKLESVCGNNGVCCQRIKKLQEQGLSSATSSLVKDVGFHALQQQHEVDDLIALLQKGRKLNDSNDSSELECFHLAATTIGITSSRAALAERRSLRKLIERARAEDDKRKESIIAYLLHLMRKYSKLFRSEFSDDNDSQGSQPCSPTVQRSLEPPPPIRGPHAKTENSKTPNENPCHETQNRAASSQLT